MPPEKDMDQETKYLLVTDIPAPWREKVFERVHDKLGNAFHVAYCSHNERRRLWTFPHGSHPKTMLKPLTIGRNRERFINIGIIPFMLNGRPRVVICFSLNPTAIIALIISKIRGSKNIVFADTWLGRDEGTLSWVQIMTRKILYNFFADAFLGASRQTLNMFKFYNKDARDESMFLSALCADNEFFESALKARNIEKPYDIMFSGRIVELKNPTFFTDVAIKVKQRRGSCRVLLIGDGDEDLKKNMFKSFKESGVEYNYSGFIEHSRLPEFYSKAKILLLPTSRDCWGVVINEAMISGLPVITTDRTAAAGELVIDGKNGFILPMDSELWTEKIVTLLDNEELLEEYSRNAKATVRNFNFERASEGIIAAIKYAEKL